MECRILILLLLRYDSDGVLAFSTVAFHLRRSWTCSVQFISLIFSKSFPDIIFPSGLEPSYWSTCKWSPFVYSLYNTDFRHYFCVSKPTQSFSFNIIYYVPVFINSSNSLFVLILQTPLSSLIGPNIFLSNTESLYIIFSLRTHVSQP